MTVLSREALEASPLADLHLIAGEIGLDGYRRLRKADLVDAIVVKQGGEPAPKDEPEADQPEADGADEQEERPRSRRSRGGRGRSRRSRDGDPDAREDRDEDAAREDEEAPKGRSGRGRSEREPREPREADGPEVVAEGTIEVLGNGSGFLRVNPPDPSDDDVYVSAAQVRRCELVSGDAVSGPVRAPRRSERYPSLVRVDTINGRPADEVAEGTPFDDLPAVHPSERFELGDEDPTLKAIGWLTPIGRGSRVVVTGAARSGKTEALRRLAGAMAADEKLEVAVVLAGARPEEAADWRAAGIEPAAVVALGGSTDAQTSAVERAVDTARRQAARGGDAVVLIDGLDGVAPAAARRALGAARNIDGGGSLTVIAVAAQPLGGETTVVALDVMLASTGRLPALDLAASGTVRPELLVGEAGATVIAQARADALGL